MAYAVVADVQKHFQNIAFTGASKPTSAQVTDFIAEVEAQLNQRLKAIGVAAPVTDNDVIAMLKPIVIHGTSAVVLRSINAESEAAATFQKLYDDAVEHLEKNPNLLTTVDAGEPVLPGYSGQAADAQRLFSREGVQW